MWRAALCLLLGSIGWLPAAAALTELRQAQVTVQIEGSSSTAPVELPYNWDRRHGGRSGTAVFTLAFEMPQPGVEPYAAYFARVGNRAEIWLNGVLLSRLGDLEHGNAADYAKAPRQVLIPAQLLQPHNELRVFISADAGRRGGLFGVWIGPEWEVRERLSEVQRWLVSGSIAVAVFSLLVGTIALLLWATQTEPDAQGRMHRSGLYLAAGVAELCWALRLYDTPTVDTPLPWPWWGMVQTLAYAGWFSGAALFCHHVAGWQRHRSMRWMRAALALLVATALLASWLGLQQGWPRVLPAWYGLASLFFLVYVLVYFVAALRQPSTARLLVAAAGLLNVLVGVRDWWVIQLQGHYTEISLVRYSSVLFGLALVHIVLMRLRQASVQARELMDNMAARVLEKERALAASYQRLEQLALEQARAQERARILRDMHDGVGAHLSTAIHQLQSGQAQPQELLQTLRDSLDQLKLSIDAMNLAPGDVTALLANLRYRLQPRLQSAGVRLVWDVELLAPLPGLDAQAMRQLQFMVFEALSNVLQHAQASELRVELRSDGASGARLRIIDDGRGFDPQQVPQRGLASLRGRAAALGARLEIASAPGQTVAEIVLPGRAQATVAG